MSLDILAAVVVDTFSGRVVNENAFRHPAMRPAVVGKIVWEPFQNVPSMKRGSSPFQKNAAKMASISKGRKRLDLFFRKKFETSVFSSNWLCCKFLFRTQVILFCPTLCLFKPAFVPGCTTKDNSISI